MFNSAFFASCDSIYDKKERKKTHFKHLSLKLSFSYCLFLTIYCIFNVRFTKASYVKIQFIIKLTSEVLFWSMLIHYPEAALGCETLMYKALFYDLFVLKVGILLTNAYLNPKPLTQPFQWTCTIN